MQLAHFFTADITASELLAAFAHAKAYQAQCDDENMMEPTLSPVKCGEMCLFPVQISARAHQLGIYSI